MQLSNENGFVVSFVTLHLPTLYASMQIIQKQNRNFAKEKREI